MRRRLAIFFIIAVISIFGAAACGGAEPGAGGTEERTGDVDRQE